MSRRYYLLEMLFLDWDETYIYILKSSKKHLEGGESTSALQMFQNHIMPKAMRIDKSFGLPNRICSFTVNRAGANFC